MLLPGRAYFIKMAQQKEVVVSAGSYVVFKAADSRDVFTPCLGKLLITVKS